ncbi:hypothetical protein [uncultured Methanobrevibacter sp.]|nr:hypothetical protein [uncultured Methanobrevibacter sp.]
MSNFENLIKNMFEMESFDEIRFKSIKISPDKTIYFAFKESQKIIYNKLTSMTLEPVCFILKMDDEYHYCPLNDNKFDENIVKEFVKNI